MIHSIFMEVRPRLQACNMCLVLKKEITHQIIVNLKRRKIIFQHQDKNFEIKFEEFGVEPLTMTSFNSNGKFISLRIQVDCKHAPQPIKSSRVDPPFEKQKPFRFICRCGNPLSEEVIFERVLPLPSGMWDTSDMFCHSHGQPATKMISPRLHDCLYGDHFLSISNKVLNVKNGTKFLRCERCLNGFGTRSDDSMILWRSDILLPNENLTLSQQFIRIIKNAIAESTLSVFVKVLLECQENDRYILILIMDKQLLLFRAEEDLKLKMEEVVKVSYTFHKTSDVKVKQWESDACVHLVQVSKTLFNTSFKLLIESSEIIPPPFKVADGNVMAYINIYTS